MTKKPLLVAIALALMSAACATDASSTTAGPVTTSTTEPSIITTAPTDTTAPAESTTTTVPLETTTTTSAVPDVIEVEISYAAGAVEGGGRIEIPLGEAVVITIQSDIADEGHLHGYDIFVDLEPGTPGSIEFVADIPGIFELELEDAGVLLADLEVAP